MGLPFPVAMMRTLLAAPVVTDVPVLKASIGTASITCTVPTFAADANTEIWLYNTYRHTTLQANDTITSTPTLTWEGPYASIDNASTAVKQRSMWWRAKVGASAIPSLAIVATNSVSARHGIVAVQVPAGYTPAAPTNQGTGSATSGGDVTVTFPAPPAAGSLVLFGAMLNGAADLVPSANLTSLFEGDLNSSVMTTLVGYDPAPPLQTSDMTSTSAGITVGSAIELMLPATAWVPTDESSLLWWLDASDVTTLTKDGADLTTAWNSKAGKAFGNITGTSGQAPTWLATGLNSRPCLDFNLKRMIGPFVHTGADTISLIIAQLTGAGASNGVIYAFAASGFTHGQAGGWAGLKQDATNLNVNSAYSGSSYGAQAITYGSPFLITGTRSASSMTNYLNGASPVGGAVANTTDFDFCSVGVGIGSSGTVGSVCANVRIAEILTFASSDTTLRQKAEGYMMHKAGLQSLLDAGHPYKAAPP